MEQGIEVGGGEKVVDGLGGGGKEGEGEEDGGGGKEKICPHLLQLFTRQKLWTWRMEKKKGGGVTSYESSSGIMDSSPHTCIAWSSTENTRLQTSF